MKNQNLFKTLVLLSLVILVCAFAFTSCIVVETPDTTDPSDDAVVTTAKDNTDEGKTATTTKAPAATTTPTKFEEVTVVENEHCVIKVKGISDTILGLSLKIELENKSQDKTFMFSISELSINGIECSSLYAEEVAATKKAISNATILVDSLEEAGVTEYTDIKIQFRVYDTNDWFSDDIALESVHIYPLGEEKAVKYTREDKAADIVIIDNEYVKAVITGYHNDIIWGYSAKLYVENKTDSTAMFSVDEASVNGFMADPFFAHTLAADTCAFTDISWSSSTLEDLGITKPNEEITNIEFVFKAQDYDNWLGDKYCEELVKIDK